MQTGVMESWSGGVMGTKSILQYSRFSFAQAIKLGGVIPIQLSFDGRRDAFAVAVDGFFGAGPSSYAVRVIAGPEKVVFAVNRSRQHAGTVVLVSEENIILKVLARRTFIDIAIGVEGALPPEPVVDLLN